LSSRRLLKLNRSETELLMSSSKHSLLHVFSVSLKGPVAGQQPIIPALKRLRQEDLKFKIRLLT
jgi:hypothetical protein